MKLYEALSVVALVFGSVVRGKITCEQKAQSTDITSFHKQKVTIQLPCKYNAVRQKCGKYLVNITPGIVSYGWNYRLNTLWLGITETNSSGHPIKAWTGRTTSNDVVKFLNGEGELFTQKNDEDENRLLTSEVFHEEITDDGKGRRRGVANAKDGSFIVTFQPWNPDSENYKLSRWTFECFEKDDIAGYPDQVCGYKNSFKANSNLTEEQLIMFNVLNDVNSVIPQVDEKCKAAEDIFQNGCSDQEQAIIACNQVLAEENRDRCLTCSPMDVFLDCLQWACGGYTDREVCERVGAGIIGCKEFQDGDLTQRVKAENCYKDFIAIDDDDSTSVDDD